MLSDLRVDRRSKAPAVPTATLDGKTLSCRRPMWHVKMASEAGPEWHCNKPASAAPLCTPHGLISMTFVRQRLQSIPKSFTFVRVGPRQRKNSTGAIVSCYFISEQEHRCLLIINWHTQQVKITWQCARPFRSCRRGVGTCRCGTCGRSRPSSGCHGARCTLVLKAQWKPHFTGPRGARSNSTL